MKSPILKMIGQVQKGEEPALTKKEYEVYKQNLEDFAEMIGLCVNEVKELTFRGRKVRIF